MALLTPDLPDSPDTVLDQARPQSEGLPTLDRRVEIFLRAVHGPDGGATADQRQMARDRIIAAMAADLAGGLKVQDGTQRVGDADVAASVASAAPIHAYAAQKRPSTIAAAASAAVQRVFGNFLSLRGFRLVPALAMLLLVIAGGAIWFLYPEASFEVASKNPESQVTGTDAFVVQILERSSEADAQAAYYALQSKFPAILGDRAPLIRRIELGDASIIYRAELGTYNSFEQGREICSKLSDAKETCMVRRR